MKLGLTSDLRDVDPRIANRRVGLRKKGPPAWEVLRGMGMETVGGLLRHYPRRYIDRSEVTAIRDLRVGRQATVIATVKRVTKRLTQRRQTMVTVQLYDGSSYLDLTFFNQLWTASLYKPGMELAVFGVVGAYRGHLQLRNEDVEILRGEADQVHTGRITPIHRAAEGISTRTIRELAFRALERLPAIPDPLPRETTDGEGLAGHDWAVRAIHFPETGEDLGRARERLKFDELFFLELGVAYRKRRLEMETAGIEHDLSPTLAKRFLAGLPFEPTAAQRRAIEEVEADMARPTPMNRLLQGDVGSGKTVVALDAAMVAIGSGHQAAIMAPTEVLAGQHLVKARELLAPLGAYEVGERPPGGQLALGDERPEHELTYGFLTAAVTGKDRQRMLEGVGWGEVDLVIGTHALVQQGVAFHDLSLAVIDEQHRFGVHQRLLLKEKGASPDVLIMTATPIPRTLALTYYGDLDVSVLDELPSGRQPIETRVVRSAGERRGAYEMVRAEVASGRQAFVVCAAIDEANKVEVRAAEQEADRLATEVFPELRVGLLHGRLRPAEKEARMDAFRTGRTDVLISTTVIEVGVDVPNATVMLVENAERFGLAQLHQLRGRIGRGAHRSFCILFDESTPDNEEARARLTALASTTDGFALADEDLRLRGEGTLFDIRQSGMPDLQLASLAEDVDLVRRARERAFAVIDDDPTLAGHPKLLEELTVRFADSIEWLFHS